MADKETKYDLPELLKGNEESVTSKLSAMNDDELAKLGELESQGDKRKGVNDAITREQASRSEAAAARAGTPTGASKGAPNPAEKAAVKEALKNADKPAATKTASRKKAVTGKVAFGAAKTNPLEGEANTVVFTDTDGNLLDIPPMQFGSEQFSPATAQTGAVILNETLTFGTELPAASIGAAWLVDDSGQGALRSAFIAPIVVGGGRSGEVPRGHLLFVPETAAQRDARLEKAA